MRTVSEDEVKKILGIQSYALLKIDPDKNKFYIIEKNDVLNYDNKLVLVTTNYELAKKFGFGPCGFGPGTFEKTVSTNEVEVKYDEEKIFLNKLKEITHQEINQSLSTLKIVAGQPQENSSKHQGFVFGLSR